MRRADLVPDCGSCAALCCVVTSFAASDDFAFDKPAGVACPHLRRDCRCAIHAELVERGFPGCAAYDCFGAGQRATRAATDPARRGALFLALREVHEPLWQLTEALALCGSTRSDLRAEIALEISALDGIALGPLEAIDELDLVVHERTTRGLLRRVGQALRAAGGRRLVVLG